MKMDDTNKRHIQGPCWTTSAMDNSIPAVRVR